MKSARTSAGAVRPTTRELTSRDTNSRTGTAMVATTTHRTLSACHDDPDWFRHSHEQAADVPSQAVPKPM